MTGEVLQRSGGHTLVVEVDMKTRSGTR